jgi:hypothetical protein
MVLDVFGWATGRAKQRVGGNVELGGRFGAWRFFVVTQMLMHGWAADINSLCHITVLHILLITIRPCARVKLSNEGFDKRAASCMERGRAVVALSIIVQAVSKMLGVW